MDRRKVSPLLRIKRFSLSSYRPAQADTASKICSSDIWPTRFFATLFSLSKSNKAPAAPVLDRSSRKS